MMKMKKIAMATQVRFSFGRFHLFMHFTLCMLCSMLIILHFDLLFIICMRVCALLQNFNFLSVSTCPSWLNFILYTHMQIHAR